MAVAQKARIAVHTEECLRQDGVAVGREGADTSTGTLSLVSVLAQTCNVQRGHRYFVRHFVFTLRAGTYM